ncbi:hypothetical protein XENOCAPTIV_020950 [Xenoophorus captivus]|uniref:Uncharacterized protein n=1 Tax=Xenoophorus captivus TaxID=1517983 RepID=A0ABV0S817_9TELE
MSSVGRQDPPGQPAFSSDYLSGPMMGGMTGQWSLNKTKDSSMPDSFLGLLYFYNPCLKLQINFARLTFHLLSNCAFKKYSDLLDF